MRLNKRLRETRKELTPMKKTILILNRATPSKPGLGKDIDTTFGFYMEDEQLVMV